MSIFSFLKNGLPTERKNRKKERSQYESEPIKSPSPAFPFEAVCSYDVTYYNPRKFDNGYLDLGYTGSCILIIDADGSITTDKDKFAADTANIYNVGETPGNPSRPYFALLSLEDRSIKIFFETADTLTSFVNRLQFLKSAAQREDSIFGEE